MLVLAIETSCDETSAAVLRAPEWGHVPVRVPPSAPEILSNIVLSQDEVHAPYGGVVPELASRQHIKTIAPTVGEAMARAGVGLDAIDLYAVTQGPGLIGSLLVGLSFAKGLAYFHKKPLIGIDHLEAHLEACFLENPAIAYPVLGLLVSGGHTALYLMEEPLSYKLLGKTRDDAAGEALDKIAKFLGLGYPGGPAIEKLGKGGDPKAFPFAVPRTKDRSLDFSFSGLKTGALKLIRENGITAENPRLADSGQLRRDRRPDTRRPRARGGGPGPTEIACPVRRRRPEHAPADALPGIRPAGRPRRLHPRAKALHRQRRHGRRHRPQEVRPIARPHDGPRPRRLRPLNRGHNTYSPIRPLDARMPLCQKFGDITLFSGKGIVSPEFPRRRNWGIGIVSPI